MGRIVVGLNEGLVDGMDMQEGAADGSVVTANNSVGRNVGNIVEMLSGRGDDLGEGVKEGMNVGVPDGTNVENAVGKEDVGENDMFEGSVVGV